MTQPKTKNSIVFPNSRKMPYADLEDCPKSPTGRHFYRLPPPKGQEIVTGVCKHCKAKKEHDAYPDAEKRVYQSNGKAKMYPMRLSD